MKRTDGKEIEDNKSKIRKRVEEKKGENIEKNREKEGRGE